MQRVNRRRFLQVSGTALSAASFVGATAAHAAVAYNFVRIEGIPNQAVGERLLKQVYSRAGMDVSVTPMPGKRALEQSSSGEMDGKTLRVFGLGERATSLIRVPTPLSSLKTVGFVRADANVQVASKEDLNNYSCVRVSGVLHTQAISQGVSNVREMTDVEAMFKVVESGRADIALTSYLDGLAVIKKLKIDGIVGLEPALNDQPLFHYVHEANKDLVEKIDPIIKAMDTSGELIDLRTRFEAEYMDAL